MAAGGSATGAGESASETGRVIPRLEQAALPGAFGVERQG